MKRTLGIVLTVFGALCLALTVVLFLDPDPKNAGAGQGGLICTGFVLVPGVLLWIWGARQRASEQKHLETLGWLKSRQSFKLTDFARVLGTTEPEAERELARLLARGDVQFTYEEKRLQYVSGAKAPLVDPHGIVPLPANCPGCNAPVPTDQQSAHCGFCGALLHSPAPSPAPGGV